MVNGIYTSASGMLPRMVQMDNVANNLANVSTTGYKKNSVFLRELITADRVLSGKLAKQPEKIPEEVWVDYTQGSFEKTGNSLDIAFNGPGFFKVKDQSGNIFYTRNGHFITDTQSNIVTSDGMYLLSQSNSTIKANGSNIAISESGDISVDGEYVATIGKADFSNDDYKQLKSIGEGLFERPANIQEKAVSSSTLVYQGYLEESNVDPVLTMIDMIQLHREFELGQKSIQIQDQSLQRVVNEVGVLRQ